MRIPTTRRIIDIAVGVIGLTIFAVPMSGLITIARLVSGHPGLFRQTRIGLHGKAFMIYKIRTLDDTLKPLRIIGNLRKLGLDELPQFINLIKGDVSIVGPRPHVEIPAVNGWDHLLEITPGLASANGVVEKKTGVPHTAAQRIQIDGPYVDLRLSNKSALATDLTILFNMVKIGFAGKADAGKYPTSPPRAPLRAKQKMPQL